MSKPNRQDLKAEFWAQVPESIEGYSDRIEMLLDTLTDEQLQEVCQIVNPDDESDVEAEDAVSQRFVLYDFDAGGLISTTLYPSYEAACEDAGRLSNVLILSIEIPADESLADDETAEDQ